MFAIKEALKLNSTCAINKISAILFFQFSKEYQQQSIEQKCRSNAEYIYAYLDDFFILDTDLI